MVAAGVNDLTSLARAVEASWKAFGTHADSCKSCALEADYCRRTPGLQSIDERLEAMHLRLCNEGRPGFELWRFDVVALCEAYRRA